MPVKQEDPEFGNARASTLEHRNKEFRTCLYIYSYDGSDSTPYEDLLNRQIDRNLARCDACIVGYYQNKRQWSDDLRR